MADIHGNKLSGDRGAGSRDRKPEPLAKSNRLVRSGMTLHPRGGMDSMTQSCFSTPPHSQACFTPCRPSQAAWEFSRQTFFPSERADSWNEFSVNISRKTHCIQGTSDGAQAGRCFHWTRQISIGNLTATSCAGVRNSLQTDLSILLGSQACRFAIRTPGR